MAVAESGLIVRASLPSGVPTSGIPRIYIFPLMVILDGVALDRFAVPPLLEKEKSPAVSAVPAAE